MKNQRNHARHLVALLLALAGFMSAVSLTPGLASLASAQGAAPNWSYTGYLKTARESHTATLLPNGKVLVAGGYDDHTALDSAELYDPATGKWSITGSLNTAGGDGTATLLPNGKVLVNWGVNSAELYDPATGTWSLTGKLNTLGYRHTATLLPNGKVLVAGGFDNHSSLNRAELYDSATGIWSITGNLNAARYEHTATLMPNGKVLVAGGFCSSGCPALNSAELYDPATGSWSTTGNLNSAPQSHTATLLPNGKVLVAADTGACELYNPATGTWRGTGNLNTIRYGHTATLLPSGKVLVAAGVDSGGDNVLSIDNAELYDPTVGLWSYTGSVDTGRAQHTMTLLANGRVLVAGGRDYDYDALSSAELFGSSTALPQITGASISGKKLFVEGENFDAGAKIILNDENQRTANDELTPTTLLIGTKAGKRIGPGETVRLNVRNSDGTESAEFSYTRAAG